MAEKETPSSPKMKTQENTPEEEVVEKLACLRLSDKQSADPQNQQEAAVDSSLCAICQDTALHPVVLPCGHRFCYLCIKGVYARRGTCALCRRPIPVTCITRPTLNDRQASSNPPPSNTTSDTSTDRASHWFYEARSSGWWQYEARTSVEIERAYTQMKTFVRVSISGFMYEVDFNRMVQYRVDRPERCRRVKREGEGESDGEVRGIAGITFTHETSSHVTQQQHETSSHVTQQHHETSSHVTQQHHETSSHVTQQQHETSSHVTQQQHDKTDRV